MDALRAVVKIVGILREGLTVTAGETELTLLEDYTVDYDAGGYLAINLVAGGAGAGKDKLSVTGYVLDPDAVTKEDVIGAYDPTTGKETGMELIRQVYPKFGVVPSVALAPGYSQTPEVGIAQLHQKRKNRPAPVIRPQQRLPQRSRPKWTGDGCTLARPLPESASKTGYIPRYQKKHFPRRKKYQRLIFYSSRLRITQWQTGCCGKEPDTFITHTARLQKVRKEETPHEQTRSFHPGGSDSPHCTDYGVQRCTGRNRYGADKYAG